MTEKKAEPQFCWAAAALDTGLKNETQHAKYMLINSRRE